MIEIILTIVLALIILVPLAGIVYIKVRDYLDPLWQHRPISEEEELLLTAVDKEFHVSYVEYIRTMEMDPKLSKYMNDNKECLEATSYFMLLRFAEADEEKKKRWESDTDEVVPAKLSYNDQKIKQCIVANPLSTIDEPL